MALFCCQSAFSQGFKVKSFQENLQDGAAFRAPVDTNGNPCGLIKVQSNCTDLTFGDDIIGEVENKTNEYWVYLPKGSKQLVVKHPNFLPLLISFQAYGVNEVASKTTYILTLNEQKYNKEKNSLVITTKPTKAALYVDDILVENGNDNGYYQLYLPKGEHICRMERTGYSPYVQAVSIGKTAQNLNVELESVLAELEIKCKTETAELYVDGELKGNGTWKGEVLAGEHLIEARQRNHESNSQTITLTEKESRMFVIPELKRSMGKLTINSNPKEVPIVVDGKEFGLTPCSIELETGKHYISCEAYGCEPYRKNIEIEGGTTQTENFTLDYINDEYRKAYLGDGNSMWGLFINHAPMCVDTNIKEQKDYDEAAFWLERMERLSIKNALLDDPWSIVPRVGTYCLTGNPQKAVSIYNKSIIDDSSDRICCLSLMGDAFKKLKDCDQAIFHYKQIEEDEIGEDYNYIYESIGDCYLTKGDKQQALLYYRKYLNFTSSYDEETLEEVKKKIKELEK